METITSTCTHNRYIHTSLQYRIMHTIKWKTQHHWVCKLYLFLQPSDIPAKHLSFCPAKKDKSPISPANLLTQIDASPQAKSNLSFSFDHSLFIRSELKLSQGRSASSISQDTKIQKLNEAARESD